MLLNMAQSTPWELIFHTKCWKRPPNETTLLASNTNVWRSKILITYQRVMTSSSASLTFHYLESFPDICEKVRRCLTPGGTFVFSVEHPVFTAYGSQDWFYDKQRNILHWPVDRYFSEGKREAIFLGENVTKFHKTLTTYVNGLIQNGFEITGLVEPEPDKTLLDSIPGMRDELRRPMMLIISSIKK